MKRTILTLTIATALLAATILQSCKKELDKEPISDIVDKTPKGGDGSGTTSITTATKAESALASAYAYFKTDGGEYYLLDYFMIGDAQSDNAYAGADNPAGFEMDEYRLKATNDWVSRDWRYLYNHISRTNAVIVNVPNVTDAALSTDRKAQIVGEAKFIRARAYFDLVRLFGDIPLVLEELPKITADNLSEIYPKLYPSRTKTADVYAQIIKDLNEAEAVVPVTATDKGFVTKGAVYTLLAKVYATQQPANWTLVKENCDKVIALGYSLVADYDHLWDGDHENTSESIFELNFDSWATGGNWGVFMFSGDDWKKFNTPSNDLLNIFATEGDNIRLGSTIKFADVSGKWTDKYLPLNNYPFANKMRKGETGNIIIYRLADVLLLKAEALNELSDLTGAQTLVNQVRARVSLGPTPATDQASMRLAIEKERRLELAFEGQRWFDLVRTNRAISVMQAVKDGTGASLGYSLNPNKLLWPIPQSQIDKNSNLTQNPGY